MRILALNHTFVRDISPELEKRRLDRLQSYASPGTTIEMDYPEDLGGSEVLHHLRKTKALSGLHHILGTPALVKKTIEAERAGFDAVVQIDAFDPGVEAARLAVRIPVVGLLRASCAFAATLCERFAITVPVESYVPYVWRMVETYRMEHFVSGIRVIDLFEVGDLSQFHDAILERTIAVARDLVAGGAQALVPLATRLIPEAVSPQEVEREVGIPVVNTQAVGIRFAELMVSSKTVHSQKSYPWAAGLSPEAVSNRASRG
ncbi:MAG TPA: aspartate/glutamate racemase family protein [Candidatus Acidoferrales bacterium]|nr:aspartate/glutamate racemase family protein [Candidatus Acidoferrales bacterium]